MVLFKIQYMQLCQVIFCSNAFTTVIYWCHDLKEDLMGTKFFFIFVKYVVYDWG